MIDKKERDHCKRYKMLLKDKMVGIFFWNVKKNKNK